MSRTEHTLSNGQAISLRTVTGTVLSAAKTSQTSIHQDAPEMLGTQAIIPGQIRSTTSTTQELWLQTADGKERAIDLVDLNLPVREGHVVSVLWGGPAWRESGQRFGACNHTTGDVRCDVSILGTSLRDWKLAVGAGRSAMLWTLWGAVGFAAPTLVVARQDKVGLAILCGLVGAVIGMFFWTFIGSSLGPGRRALALTEEINSLGRKALVTRMTPEHPTGSASPSSTARVATA